MQPYAGMILWSLADHWLQPKMNQHYMHGRSVMQDKIEININKYKNPSLWNFKQKEQMMILKQLEFIAAVQ